MTSGRAQSQISHHNSSSNRHMNKRYRTTATMLPAVPFAQPRLLQSAPQQNSHPVPSMDPETLPATQGLNEWGAFTGAGGNISSNSGTFGLGPLLFRQGCVEETETATTTTEGMMSPPLSGRDLVEKDRLLRNDPVSFNPMQAISWAQLDEDVVEKATPPQPEKEAKGGGKENAGSLPKGGGGVEYEQGVYAPNPSGKSRQSDSNEHTAYNPNTTSVTSLSTSIAKDVQQRHSENKEPEGPPIGNMDVARSNEHGVFVPQTTVSSVNTTHRIDSVQPQVRRQQRKHRHRLGKRAGPSPVDTYTQQAPGYQRSSSPTSSALGSIPAQPLPAHYQVAYTNYSTQSPSNHPFHSPASLQRQDVGLFSCPAPSCQAHFPSDAQLNTHYHADHAGGPYSNNGRQPPYPFSNTLACSWPSCGAGRFTSENALMWHVKAEHLLLCPVPQCCHRVFPSRKQVDAHVRNRGA